MNRLWPEGPPNDERGSNVQAALQDCLTANQDSFDALDAPEVLQHSCPYVRLGWQLHQAGLSCKWVQILKCCSAHLMLLQVWRSGKARRPWMLRQSGSGSKCCCAARSRLAWRFLILPAPFGLCASLVFSAALSTDEVKPTTGIFSLPRVQAMPQALHSVLKPCAPCRQSTLSARGWAASVR